VNQAFLKNASIIDGGGGYDYGGQDGGGQQESQGYGNQGEDVQYPQNENAKE
jgi:hypothetical protein